MSVPENLDSTMQLLFMASKGDVDGVEELLDEGIDVNSIDLDGRTALHIASCEGHYDVVKVLLSRRANIDARDRWGSTVCSSSFFFPIWFSKIEFNLISGSYNRIDRDISLWFEFGFWPKPT